MATSSETTSQRRLLDALALLSRACADGAVPEQARPREDDGDAGAPPAPLGDAEKEVLGEAGLAVAFGAFLSRGDEGGAIQTLIATLGLLAALAGEEPDPPAEILGIAAEDARVEAEIDRAGEAMDREFGRESSAEALTAALEARILGSAITLAGCTLPEGVEGQRAVRLGAARCLARLAAGLLAMNAAGALSGTSPGADPGANRDAPPG
ncbi:MAG TPA: hypothetical protein VGN83_22430 [Falsiroseomonas sp.]|jgi:hypothetical protein|nr:hypothetical protein [Falsiroseomonas sp.]